MLAQSTTTFIDENITNEEIIRRNIRLKVRKNLRNVFGNYVYLYRTELPNTTLDETYFYILTNERKRYILRYYELEQEIF